MSQDEASTRSAGTDGSVADGSADSPAYGMHVSSSLLNAWQIVSKQFSLISDDIFDELRLDPDFRQRWELLSSEGKKFVKQRDAAHVQFILWPLTSEADHHERAAKLGRSHELSCLELPFVIKYYNIIYRKIAKILKNVDIKSEDKETILMYVAQRIGVDSSIQARVHYEFSDLLNEVLFQMEKIVQEVDNLQDLLHEIVKLFSALDGISAILFSRPDVGGVMQIEAFGGRSGNDYANALIDGRAPLFSIEAGTPAGEGPAGKAWRSRQIQVVGSIYSDPTVLDWKSTRRDMRLISSAAVPLLDLSGETFALLSLYSFAPGYFSGSNRTTMLRQVQQVMSQAVRLSENSKVIPVSTRRRYYEWVANGRAEMLYQPILDLRTGEVAHVEALARLRDAEDKFISPAAFLPALGNAGLLKLFQVGLEQACRDVGQWRRNENLPKFRVAINLPCEALTDDVYKESLMQTVARWDVPPDVFQLEVLESQDPFDVSRSDARIADFRRLGFRIVQDDLGSGHSSLLRLDRIPFDGVKIDQALVRRAASSPRRALEFIYHLVGLAHDVNVPVTVEGLEDSGLIEAATILGADFGQGYGIARPMRAGDVARWIGDAKFSFARSAPRTILGLLASFLLWDRENIVFFRDSTRISGAYGDPLREKLRGIEDGRFNPDLFRSHLDAYSALSSLSMRNLAYVEARNGIIAYLTELWISRSPEGPASRPAA